MRVCIPIPSSSGFYSYRLVTQEWEGRCIEVEWVEDVAGKNIRSVVLAALVAVAAGKVAVEVLVDLEVAFYSLPSL
jgi:hypothetical protein